MFVKVYLDGKSDKKFHNALYLMKTVNFLSISRPNNME